MSTEIQRQAREILNTLKDKKEKDGKIWHTMCGAIGRRRLGESLFSRLSPDAESSQRQCPSIWDGLIWQGSS
jgi:hypothetical protein